MALREVESRTVFPNALSRYDFNEEVNPYELKQAIITDNFMKRVDLIVQIGHAVTELQTSRLFRIEISQRYKKSIEENDWLRDQYERNLDDAIFYYKGKCATYRKLCQMYRGIITNNS